MKGKGIVNTYNLAMFPEHTNDAAQPSNVKGGKAALGNGHRLNQDKRVSSAKSPFQKGGGSTRYARSSKMIKQVSGQKLAKLAQSAIPTLQLLEGVSPFEPVKQPSRKHIVVRDDDSGIGSKLNFDRGFLAAMSLKDAAFNLKEMLQPLRPLRELADESKASKDYEVCVPLMPRVDPVEESATKSFPRTISRRSVWKNGDQLHPRSTLLVLSTVPREVNASR